MANRRKKREEKERCNEGQGPSPDEVKALNEKDVAYEALLAEAREFHRELFPEEYDFMLDSIADARKRARGVNPMTSEYQNKINHRRARMGFDPLGKDGMPTSIATLKFVGLAVYDGDQTPLANLITSLGLGKAATQENPND